MSSNSISLHESLILIRERVAELKRREQLLAVCTLADVSYCNVCDWIRDPSRVPSLSEVARIADLSEQVLHHLPADRRAFEYTPQMSLNFGLH